LRPVFSRAPRLTRRRAESRGRYDRGEDIKMEPNFNPHYHFQHFQGFPGGSFTFTF
jgi:hypothetical protein